MIHLETDPLTKGSDSQNCLIFGILTPKHGMNKKGITYLSGEQAAHTTIMQVYQWLIMNHDAQQRKLLSILSSKTRNQSQLKIV